MTTKGVSEVEDLHYSHVVYKFRSPTGHKVVDSEVQLGCTAYINADRVPCRLAGGGLELEDQEEWEDQGSDPPSPSGMSSDRESVKHSPAPG
eukprot:CAMPEP_0204385032 /NCGR_PEP_ID=MMETSP0469-20131031/57376_1 /ASSEMBLY_ACC=CAM_ASM_000384 /TAXON_ID=2969 /ORGANISM="Oxyrrhis marina" /LENGTH=91 /DNA_ID=CAMNT_0051377855 /DNA_START=231 /DNA_END=501 /DNA_ORIENTATION=-